jgi:hypothetical protein
MCVVVHRTLKVSHACPRKTQSWSISLNYISCIIDIEPVPQALQSQTEKVWPCFFATSMRYLLRIELHSGKPGGSLYTCTTVLSGRLERTLLAANPQHRVAVRFVYHGSLTMQSPISSLRSGHRSGSLVTPLNRFERCGRIKTHPSSSGWGIKCDTVMCSATTALEAGSLFNCPR